MKEAWPPLVKKHKQTINLDVCLTNKILVRVSFHLKNNPLNYPTRAMGTLYTACEQLRWIGDVPSASCRLPAFA